MDFRENVREIAHVRYIDCEHTLWMLLIFVYWVYVESSSGVRFLRVRVLEGKMIPSDFREKSAIK